MVLETLNLNIRTNVALAYNAVCMVRFFNALYTMLGTFKKDELCTEVT